MELEVNEWIERLRAELAARPLAEASGCPSWAGCARALARAGEAELGAWLDAAVRAPWVGAPRRERVERAEAVLERCLDALALWRGTPREWSEWLGPFVLAYVGPRSAEELGETLGIHARLLAPDRVFGPSEARALGGDEVELRMIASACRAQREVLASLLWSALRERWGERAVDESALSYGGRDFFGQRPEPEVIEGRHALIELGRRSARASLVPQALVALRSARVVGPRELLVDWPAPVLAGFESIELDRSPGGGPRPRERGSRLFAGLREELGARTLAAAPSCPSWPVFGDWLRSEGHARLAAWLEADLAAAAPGPDQASRQRRADALAEFEIREGFAPTRPSETAWLHELWAARGERGAWLGPFMLAYFDPLLEREIGRDELRLRLGVHGSLLADARIYTGVDEDWIEEALRPQRGASLAALPLPEAGVTVARCIAERGSQDEIWSESVRVVLPGRMASSVVEGAVATHVGPIAPDHEASVVLCCASVADIERHAALWHELEAMRHVLVLAPPELLERWPHPHTRLAPWPGLGDFAQPSPSRTQ